MIYKMIYIFLRLFSFFVQQLEYVYQCYLLITALSTFIVLIGVTVPVNWTMKIRDVGYPETSESKMTAKFGKTGRKVGKIPPAYPNGWFMLCEANTVKTGQVLYIEALGEHFAVVRGASGAVHVLDAYCPHNGANIAIGGQVIGDCIQCPFHHWKFDASTGLCINIPYSAKVPSIARVKHWLSHQVNDFIFVWYHAENDKPSWHIRSIEQIKNREFIFHGRNEFIVNCHIQEVPENGGDLSHFNAVHSATMLGGSDLRFLQKAVYHVLKHVWTASWEAGSKNGFRHIGYGKLHHEMVLGGKFILSPNDVDIYQIGPGYVELIVESTFGPIILLQTVTPLGPLLQKIVHRLYCPQALKLYASFLLLAESIMIERDIMVWNHKTYKDTPIVVSEEQTLVKHRRWFSQFYTEHSPRLTQNNSLDW